MTVASGQTRELDHRYFSQLVSLIKYMSGKTNVYSFNTAKGLAKLLKLIVKDIQHVHTTVIIRNHYLDLSLHCPPEKEKVGGTEDKNSVCLQL